MYGLTPFTSVGIQPSITSPHLTSNFIMNSSWSTQPPPQLPSQLPLSHSTIANVTSEAADDQLALALTDWERLLEVGVDLTTSHADCGAINALFGKRILSLQPTTFVTFSTAFFKNLQRLGKMRERLLKIGTDSVTDSRLVAVCERLVQLKTNGHPALVKVHTMQGAEKSELLRLKDLEQWARTRLDVHSSFPDAKCALAKLEKVIAYELRQLPSYTVNSDDSTFLKALELGSKIRKNLSCEQHHVIDRIIASKIDALQNSRAVTFSVSYDATFYCFTH